MVPKILGLLTKFILNKIHDSCVRTVKIKMPALLFGPVIRKDIGSIID